MAYRLLLTLVFGWAVGSTSFDLAGRAVGLREGLQVFGGACSGTRNCDVLTTCSENCGQADRSRALSSGSSKADYIQSHQCLKGISSCLLVEEAYGCDVNGGG
jgi:hypothetical protein